MTEASHANPDVRAHTRDAGTEHASTATPAAPAPGAGASEAPVCLCEAFCCGSAGEPRAKRAKPDPDARARKPRTSLERAAALVRSRYLDSLMAVVRREHAGSVTLERARRLRQLRLAEESLLRIARKGMR